MLTFLKNTLYIAKFVFKKFLTQVFFFILLNFRKKDTKKYFFLIKV